MTHWTESAVFYHLYPLGFFGCEPHAITDVHHRLPAFSSWIPHLKDMHINAIYMGPVFSSYEHGYDTSDYYTIDPRLGTNEDFRKLCKELKENGIRIVLDGVFHHVGRDFWAFRDVLEKQEASPYADWFHIRFHQPAPWGDPFTYDTWEGHHNLVKLNLRNEAVTDHLLNAVAMWIEEFHIDGLRLDAADCIDPDFFRRLRTFCKRKRPDFWLMGEIIHGDYTRWANPDMLDSVTNYECYKGLYSSHNEHNYFEIAYSLNRQFGEGGIYKDLLLYNFADNHDVSRLASTVKNSDDLKNIYTMLYTMPGIPSIYYGSEYAIEGTKHHGSDRDLRPCLIDQKPADTPLLDHIRKLGELYERSKILHHGSYRQVLVRNEQFVFCRTYNKEYAYVVCNVSEQEAKLEFPVPKDHMKLVFGHADYSIQDATMHIAIAPKDACIFISETACGNIPTQPKAITQHKDTVIKPGRYRHFKGKEYAVLYTATHSETLEDYVVYRQLYGEERIWVRPLSMFSETVERDGIQQPRFTYIGK